MNKINKNYYPYFITDFCNSLLNILLNKLPKNKLCVIDPKTIAYKFDSEADAARFLIPQKVAHLSNEDLKQNKNSQHIHQVINKNVLTIEKEKFYLLKNPGYSPCLTLVILIFILLVLKFSLPRLSEILFLKLTI